MKQNQEAENVVSFVEKVTQEKYFHNALHRTLRSSRQKGIGVERKRAHIITQEIENKLWDMGVLGFSSSPQYLLNAVFFYNG